MGRQGLYIGYGLRDLLNKGPQRVSANPRSACLFWLVGLPRNLFTELMSDEAQAGAPKSHGTEVGFKYGRAK